MEAGDEQEKRKKFREETFVPAHPMIVNGREILTDQARAVIRQLRTLLQVGYILKPPEAERVIDGIICQIVSLDEEYEDAMYGLYCSDEDCQIARTELERVQTLHDEAHWKLAEQAMQERP